MLKSVKKFLFDPRPSLFDVAVGGFLLTPWIKGAYEKAVFFAFYTAFLVLISIGLKKKREYKSLPLSLIGVWSLICVFVHSYYIYPKAMAQSYFLYYVMAEGFLYVFFGILFIKTVLTYSKNLRFIYPLIPFAIIPWYSGLIRTGSSTPVAAIGVAILIYLFLRKRLLAVLITAFSGIIWAIKHFSWLLMKFSCRPKVWSQMFINMFYHPVKRMEGEVIDPGITLSPFLEKFLTNHFGTFTESVKPWLASLFGGGYPHSLFRKYVWVDTDKYGWIYRHNDLLNFADALGPIVLVLLVWFLARSIRTIGVKLALIPFMAIIMICFFQMTMFVPDKAGIFLLIGVLCICEGLKKEAT